MFYFIKSETSDSFVNHFDGHFAYFKNADFYFKSFQFRTFDGRFQGNIVAVKGLKLFSLPSLTYFGVVTNDAVVSLSAVFLAHKYT